MNIQELFYERGWSQFHQQKVICKEPHHYYTAPAIPNFSPFNGRWLPLFLKKRIFMMAGPLAMSNLALTCKEIRKIILESENFDPLYPTIIKLLKQGYACIQQSCKKEFWKEKHSCFVLGDIAVSLLEFFPAASQKLVQEVKDKIFCLQPEMYVEEACWRISYVFNNTFPKVSLELAYKVVSLCTSNKEVFYHLRCVESISKVLPILYHHDKQYFEQVSTSVCYAANKLFSDTKCEAWAYIAIAYHLIDSKMAFDFINKCLSQYEENSIPDEELFACAPVFAYVLAKTHKETALKLIEMLKQAAVRHDTFSIRLSCAALLANIDEESAKELISWTVSEEKEIYKNRAALCEWAAVVGILEPSEAIEMLEKCSFDKEENNYALYQAFAMAVVQIAHALTRLQLDPEKAFDLCIRIMTLHEKIPVDQEIGEEIAPVLDCVASALLLHIESGEMDTRHAFFLKHRALAARKTAYEMIKKHPVGLVKMAKAFTRFHIQARHREIEEPKKIGLAKSNFDMDELLSVINEIEKTEIKADALISISALLNFHINRI